MNYNVNDTIVLLEDIPEFNLITGELGVIIMKYKTKTYEVEFVTNYGIVRATVVLSSDKFKKFSGQNNLI